MRIEQRGDTLRIYGLRQLDAATASIFQDKVTEAMTGSLRHIEVDLSRTVFLDSCGLGRLVALRKLVCARGGTVRLLNPAPPVQQMLELTRLHRVLEVVRGGEITATPT